MPSRTSLHSSFFMILLLVLSLPLQGQTKDRSWDLLNRLQGSWIMKGSVMKKPVTYTADVEQQLLNQFLTIHMKDASPIPRYEAMVFIGIDTARQQYVAHWLDSFGGSGARVVATGPLSQERIELIYPYDGRRFRNLITYDPAHDSWRLIIESESTNDQWSEFASYAAARK